MQLDTLNTSNRYRAADLRPEIEASILARALELAAETARSAVSAEDAWRAASSHATDKRGWPVVASSAARALGRQPSLVFEPPARLARDRPALVRTGVGRWLVAVGQRGRRLRVVQLDERGEMTRFMTAKQLQEATADQPWLHLRPLLGLDPITVHRQPKFRDSPWLRLRAFLELERRDIWVVVVYALVIGGLTLATPIAAQALVNTVAFGAVLQPLVVLTVLLLGVLGFAGVLGVLEAYVIEVLQRRVFVRVAEDFGRRLSSLRTEVLDTRYGPELTNRFFDVLTIQKTLSVLLLDGLALALQAIIGMILLGFYHPLLLTFDVVLLLLLVVVIALGRGAVEAGYRESGAKYRTAAWLEDISRVTHLFRGTSAQRYAAQRTETLCRDYLSARKSHFRILLRQIAGGIGLQVIAMVALLGVGGWLVINRQLTLGQLVAAELVIATVGSSFVKLGKNLEKVYDLNVGILKVAKVVDLPTERRGGEPLDVERRTGMELRDVRVSRGGRPLLSELFLSVAADDRLRLEGPAGAGKSTLLEVLAGLREPDVGSVLAWGADMRRTELTSVREEIALVRGAEFVDGSIIENIRLQCDGRLGEAAVRELLAVVDLENAIDDLPEGLETRLLPRGAPLSERQARRLALVRALAASPRALLLDRALDGLGLPPAAMERLLDRLFDPGAPWFIVVVTDDPVVAARCTREVHIHGQRLEVVQ